MKVNRYAAGLLAAGILLTGLGGCAGGAPENSPAPPSASISAGPVQTPEERRRDLIQKELGQVSLFEFFSAPEFDNLEQEIK